ncbi:MAG: hypothetical protein JW993_20055 [Sedimentisphaerales bacterium]|nr:hypothetical protein [Sedimentisphaerales bacterium]
MQRANRAIYLTVSTLVFAGIAAGAPGERTRLPFSSQCLYRTPLWHTNDNEGVVSETVGVGRSFGIVINTTLYGQIIDSIDTYIVDLESDGWQVVLYAAEGGTGNKFDPNAWSIEDFTTELEAARQLREVLKNEYGRGMVGCILIGELPAAWSEMCVALQPVDLYFRDLSGQWEDCDRDGTLDKGPDDVAIRPEIWMSRLYVPRGGLFDEVRLMQNYFSKNHAYRQGELVLPQRALDYIDEVYDDTGCDLDDSCLSVLYGDVTLITDNQTTSGTDFKQRLKEGYEFIRLTVHGGHSFKDTPDYATAYAHTYVHSLIAQAVQLRLGSDDGMKVWLNGQNVYTSAVCRSHALDQDIVDVALSEGWNRLLVKLSENCGSWRFSARLADSEGLDKHDLSYQLDNPDIFGEAPFIRSWLINGFYYDPNTPWWHRLESEHIGGEDTIDPTEGQFDGLYAWTRVDVDQPYVNLDAALAAQQGLEFGVGYAFVGVHSDNDQTVQLWLGCNFGMTACLNGENVFTYNDSTRGWSADEHKLNVTIREGYNRLLLKISKWCGNCGFGFSARFAHPDGTAVTGLEYDPAPAPVRYIKNWLMNGWYKNPDKDACLSAIDYLGGETSVTPSEGETNGAFVWKAHSSDTHEIDLNWNVFGRYVREDMDYMTIDPCCLFYEFYSCGSYAWWQGWIHGEIFSPSFGLVSWGWGRLYETHALYEALEDRGCFGEAQFAYLRVGSLEVGDDHGPVYFGMFGDPTLALSTPPTVYVDADAQGLNNGSSWDDAFRCLQDALIRTHPRSEIRVAEGTYFPDVGAAVTVNDRTATFQLKNGLVMKGGYAGSGAVDGEVRDPRLFETILSGQIGAADPNDNSYHVITARSVRSAAVLDGFTITGGIANGNESYSSGGGVYVEGGSPTIANCIVQDNAAADEGGGMFSHNASPVMSTCTFHANAAPNHRGGGISVVGGSPSLVACVFTQNSATWAGGLYCTSSKPTLVNCRFSANQARYGGAMRCHFSDARLTNCTLSGNQASIGGAIYNSGGNSTLVNCILWGNIPEQISGDATVSFSDIEGGWPGAGEGNVDVHPMFADLTSGDYHLKSQTGRWDLGSQNWVHDSETSPCIDAGDPSVPVGDEPEPNGRRINMGAYGGTAEASKSAKR